MVTLKRVENYFRWAIDAGLLQFEKDGHWLTVQVRTPRSATPSADGYTYTLVCAQDLDDYTRLNPLVNRITLMLAQQLASSRQDVNILMEKKV